MSNSDQMEACFNSLNEIRDRLTFSHKELSEYEKRISVLPNKAKSLSPRDRSMIRILTESVMLNLYKFNEINDHSLTKILKELDINFLKYTKECLKPFKKMMPQIKDYRHYVAHSEKRSKELMLYTDIDPNFYNNHPKLNLLTKLVIFYIDCVFENFFDILNDAELALKLKIRKNKNIRNKNTGKIEVYRKEIEKIIEIVNSNLEKKGYKKVCYR